MTELLTNALSEDHLTPGFWNVATAADRWRGVRERLSGIIENIDEDSGDALESLCFIVDECLNDAGGTGKLDEYAAALQEIADVMLSEGVDPSIQALVVGELQKIVLPA